MMARVDERCLRAAAAIAEVGADCAVLTGFDDVCYVTGYVADLESGPSAFAGGPAAAIVSSDGEAVLVLSNAEEAEAPRAAELVLYEGFSSERDPPRHDLYVEAVLGSFARLGLGGVVAVEPTLLPYALGDGLTAGSATRLVDVRGALARQRSTKTDAELEALRACARLAGVGQDAAARALAAGRSEIEVFGEVRSAIERSVGERVQVVADLLTGAERTAAAMGPPTDRTLADGDVVICDVVPRYRGYWGDSCNTLAVGAVSDAFRALHEVALRAMDLTIELLRPGISAGELDRAVRSFVTEAGYELPIHLGHGIGCANFEHPLIVGEETAQIRPGMVLMLEPGAYAAGVGGVRLEWMFHVTETGAERMSDFAFATI
jgi:Xaa-Pro aminopeptidase